MKKPKVKVVKINTQGFELSDGRYFPHPIPLSKEELPTVEEFQEYYDHWFNLLSIADDRETTYNC